MVTQTKVSWEKFVMLVDSYDREFQLDKNYIQEHDSHGSGKNGVHRSNEPQRPELEVNQIDTVTPQATWNEVLKRGSPLKPNMVNYNNTSQNDNNNKNCQMCGDSCEEGKCGGGDKKLSRIAVKVHTVGSITGLDNSMTQVNKSESKTIKEQLKKNIVGLNLEDIGITMSIVILKPIQK